jgi:hypothetical protein
MRRPLAAWSSAGTEEGCPAGRGARHPTWLAGKEPGQVPFRIEGAAARFVFQPLLADQRVLEVANVIWCTGFGPDFAWIDLPVFGEDRSEPMHHRGVVASQPGQYFVGLSFLYAMPSGFLPGVDRDAEHVVVSILAGAERTSARPGQTADHRVRHPMGAG